MAESENIGGSDTYFEGVEKLLEIWYKPSTKFKNADLRNIPRYQWDALLRTVRCEIISETHNQHIDAYVLSESSMFVSKRRFILKTCGTTTPLQCFVALRQLVAKETGLVDIENLFYSRKNYKRPELQEAPHRAFNEEVAFLNQFFDDGQDTVLGYPSGECWFLYTVSRGGGGSISNGWIRDIMQQPLADPDPDQTIEVLMTELDPDVMDHFTQFGKYTAQQVTEQSGIAEIIPGMVIDDVLFDPCGYSMNGIMNSGCYMTIHITPQAEFSYVSFESNIAKASYAELIASVIETFKPGKFIVTVFANRTSLASGAHRNLEHISVIGQWQRRALQYCKFDTYDLTYAQYCKYPS